MCAILGTYNSRLFIGMYIEKNLLPYHDEFLPLVKELTELENPILTFILNTIFNGCKGIIPYNPSRTFTSLKVAKPKAIHKEVKTL